MGSARGGNGRVAVVSHVFYPNVGGSERYHLLTSRALLGDAEVAVFTSELNLPEPRAAAPVVSEVDGVPVHYLRSRPVEAERFVGPLVLWRALRAFDPDVVWTNHPSPTADVAAIFAILTRRPWVATYQADVSTGRWWNRRYLGWEMRLLRRANTVIVTSDRYRERLVGRGLGADRVVAIALGPLSGGGSPPPAPRTSPEPGAFLAVGGLDAAHSYKRFDLLIEAIAALASSGADVRLDLVGDGDQRATLERLAARRGVGSRVRFLGSLSDAALADRYANALALVIPSPEATEGFGAVAVEAVQYGCPVIVSRNVAVGDVLGRAAAIFDPARPDSLAETMRAVASDSGLRARLSEAAWAVAPSVRWDRLLPQHTAPVLAALRNRRRR